MSGRNGGGSEYTRSRTELGAKKLRWVSKNPTDKKNGSGCRSLSALIAAGRDRVHACVRDLVDDVVTEHVRIGRDVLLADQLGVVSGALSIGRCGGRSR